MLDQATRWEVPELCSKPRFSSLATQISRWLHEGDLPKQCCSNFLGRKLVCSSRAFLGLFSRRRIGPLQVEVRLQKAPCSQGLGPYPSSSGTHTRTHTHTHTRTHAPPPSAFRRGRPSRCLLTHSQRALLSLCRGRDILQLKVTQETTVSRCTHGAQPFSTREWGFCVRIDTP